MRISGWRSLRRRTKGHRRVLIAGAEEVGLAGGVDRLGAGLDRVAVGPLRGVEGCRPCGIAAYGLFSIVQSRYRKV